MADYPAFIIRQMLQEVGNDWDFELFSTRHYTAIEGYDYLPTSRNYDLGRDGRAVRKRIDGESYIVASMQKERLEAKAMGDLKKLMGTVSKPAKVRLCLAFLKTEQERQQIELAARRKYRSIEFEVTGIVQIVEEVERHSAAFETVYEAALNEVRRQQESVDRTPQPSLRLGFRVLLATQFDQSAIALRRGILSGLILQSTKEGIAIPQNHVLQSVSEALGLNHPIEPLYIAEVLQQLEDSGHISIEQNGDIRRRRSASDFMGRTGNDAASRILEGFGALRNGLERHFGEPIKIADFQKIWNAIKIALVKLFQRYGTEFVEFVHGLAASGATGLPRTIPESPMEGLRKVATSIDGLDLSLSYAKVQQLIRILPDALLDKPSGAQKWLAQLCLGYVCGCSLGLHPDALKRMEARLRTWDIMPDTHVTLSALGRGEKDHDEIKALLRHWLKAGGRLFSIDPMLREAVRHADLAMSAIERWSQKCNRRRRGASRTITSPPDANVFLRSAIALHGDRLGPSSAENHVRQFMGPPNDPVGRIRKILEMDFGFSNAPPLEVDKQLVETIYNVLAATRVRAEYDFEGEARNARARCRYDAEALAYLAAYRASAAGKDRVAVILSHSTHLRNIHDRFHDRLGFASPCIDPARLLFALSLSPGATFTMASLESTLFGSSFQKQVKQHEQLAQKVLDTLADQMDDGSYTATLAERVDSHLMKPSLRRPKRMMEREVESEWP